MVKKTNRNTILSVVIVLSFALVTVCVFHIINQHNAETPVSEESVGNSTATTDSEPIAPSDELSTAESAISPADDLGSNPADKTPTQYEGTDPDSSATLEAILTYYGRQDDSYLVNINIAQYTTGTCKLSLGSYTGTVNIEQSAASSACSFRINPSALTAGQQTLTVDVTSSSRRGHLEENIDVSL